MSIITDSYSVTLSDPGLILIEYRSRRDTAAGPLTRNTSIWFERTNLRWLVESLRQCITLYGQPELSTQHGNVTVRGSTASQIATRVAESRA